MSRMQERKDRVLDDILRQLKALSHLTGNNKDVQELIQAVEAIR